VCISWIKKHNLKAFCEIISQYVEYDFSDDDWIAIRYGLQKTYTEQGKWFEYSISGRDRVLLQIGYDEPGSNIVFVSFKTSPSINIQIQTVIDIASFWTLTR
jgi:hypothetical protein